MSSKKDPTFALTPEDIRGRTDRGEFHDKIGAPDPAIAPLGTDSEAAGAPLPAESSAEAGERRKVAEEAGAAHDAQEFAAVPVRPRSGAARLKMIVVSAALAVSVALLVWAALLFTPLR